MNEEWTCCVCAGVIKVAGSGGQSIQRHSLRRGSPTFNLLSKLLGIRDGDNVVLGIPRDAEVLGMCDTCSTVVQDLSDLQELLASTQKALRQKVDWIRKRNEWSSRNNRTENRSPYMEQVFGSTVNSGCRSSVSLKEGPETFHVSMKAEPDDFEGERYDDFAEPVDSWNFEAENLCVPDKLAFSSSPDRINRKVVSIPSEGVTEREFEEERELLELHGLDYNRKPRVCLQRMQHSESHFRKRSGHAAPGTRCRVNQIDDKANINNTNAGATDVEQEESDRDELDRLVDDDDPDFLPVELAGFDRERRKRLKSFKTRGSKRKSSSQQSLGNFSGSSIKERRIQVSQSLTIIIKDGKMLFGKREIKEDDNKLLCCYRTCGFTMQKAETEEDSSKKMLEHLAVEHIEKTRQLKKSPPARSECSVCGKPLLISGINKHQWSHKNEEEKLEWLALGKPNPIEADQRKKEKNQKTLPHQCATCGKGFAYKAALKSHQELHKNVSERQKCICEECGQIFITEEGRKLHYRRAHEPDLNLGKWKFCPICPDVKYLIRTHLESHMVKHHGGEKKFICEQCGHKSASKENLARHMFVHLKEGERPFQCDFCSMNYKHKNNLARHLATSHPDRYVPGVPMIKRSDKPKPVILTCKQMYPCGSCDRPFELPSRMRKHQQNCKR